MFNIIWVPRNEVAKADFNSRFIDVDDWQISRSLFLQLETLWGPLIKVLCEQTREVNKRIKMSFGLCLILFGFGNIVADFHVLFRVRGN